MESVLSLRFQGLKDGNLGLADSAGLAEGSDRIAENTRLIELVLRRVHKETGIMRTEQRTGKKDKKNTRGNRSNDKNETHNRRRTER